MLRHTLAVALLALVAAYALVRGGVVHQNGAPAIGYAVTVWRADIGRSNPAYTGNDGRYELGGIPPGEFVLECWYTNEDAVRVPLQVVPPVTYAPLLVVP